MPPIIDLDKCRRTKAIHPCSTKRAVELLHNATNPIMMVGNGVDLTKPEINYTALGQGFGVPVWRATVPDELPYAINQFLSYEGPAVLETVLDPSDMEKRPG